MTAKQSDQLAAAVGKALSQATSFQNVLESVITNNVSASKVHLKLADVSPKLDAAREKWSAARFELKIDDAREIQNTLFLFLLDAHKLIENHSDAVAEKEFYHFTSDAIAHIAHATNLEELRRAKADAVGDSSVFKIALKQLSTLPEIDKKAVSASANAAITALTSEVAVRQAEIEVRTLVDRLETERVDLTLPAPPRRRGRVHPTMQAMDELIEISAAMGFAVATGPDIEDDWKNFTALNFPPGHPAREMHDTFFFKPDADGERLLLRTHTSPVQVRTMMSQKPPIRIVAPGRVFRCDSDQTHTPMFHQLEGLVIDRGIHMGHLKWTLETFIRRYFETDVVTTRFRPHHFPFTEPSAEMDVQCDRSGGEVKIGQGSDWLEILGCGMVHPNVLRACGLDPDEWQGFAFGLGVDRLAMLKYGMPDLREMFAADVRWLDHYGFSPFAAPSAARGLS